MLAIFCKTSARIFHTEFIINRRDCFVKNASVICITYFFRGKGSENQVFLPYYVLYNSFNSFFQTVFYRMLFPGQKKNVHLSETSHSGNTPESSNITFFLQAPGPEFPDFPVFQFHFAYGFAVGALKYWKVFFIFTSVVPFGPLYLGKLFGISSVKLHLEKTVRVQHGSGVLGNELCNRVPTS